MLTQLDTIIGFAVVMSLVSLMIMVLTQMASAFLGLRGMNLADALETLVHKLDPQVDSASCRRLITEALTQPVLSDSILSMRTKDSVFVRNLPPLRWLRARWKLATAIRPDELMEFLQEKASGPVGTMLASLEEAERSLPIAQSAAAAPAFDWAPVQAAVASAKQLILSESGDAAGRQAQWAAVQAALSGVRAAGLAVAAGTQPPPAWSQALGTLERIAAAVPAFEAARSKLSAPGEWTAAVASLTTSRRILAALNAGPLGAVSQPAADRLEKWFNSAQDRAQQWFAMHTRALTVAGAVVAAFLLQLDTLELLRTLSTNPDVRAKLVARADALERQSEGLVSQEISSATHRQVMQQIRQEFPSSAVPAGLDNLPPSESTREKAEAWLAVNLRDNPGEAAVVARYDQVVRREQLGQDLATLQNLGLVNQQAGLQLMPDPYPLQWNPDWPHSADHWYSFMVQSPGKYWSWPLRHLAGILLSAILLSLGGPFWFNLLKQLSDLRPALADAVDQKPKQTAATS